MNNPWRYRSPDQLLQELWITAPEEIDIEAIATHCGATVLYEPLRGCEARILGRDDRAIITVNSASRRERQRFSAAHELGHWMQDHGKMAAGACSEQAFATEWFKENPEYRANRYAADLLLPRAMFCDRARKQPVAFATVRDLAQQFQTSLTATAIRLVELGSFPAMAVCNTLQKREWFCRGPSIPEGLWLLDEPGRDTVAYDLLRGSTEDAGPADVPASGWFAASESSRYLIREDSVRITPRLILTVLWWKDERQLLEMEW
jgi:hypothetical protein